MTIFNYIKNKMYHYYQSFLLYMMVFFGIIPSKDANTLQTHLATLVKEGKTDKAKEITGALSSYQKRFLIVNEKGENLSILIDRLGSKELTKLESNNIPIPPEWAMHQLQFFVHPKYEGMNYKYIHHFQKNYLHSKSLSDRINDLPADMASDVKTVLTMLQNNIAHLYETRLKDNDKVVNTPYDFYLEPEKEVAYYMEVASKLPLHHSLIHFTGYSEKMGHSASLVITRTGNDQYKLSVMERVGLLHPFFDPIRKVPYIEVSKNELEDIFKTAITMQACTNRDNVYPMMFSGRRGEEPKIFGKSYKVDESITDQPLEDLELPNNSICGTTNITYAYKAIFYNFLQATKKYTKEQIDELYKYFHLSYLEAGVNFYHAERENSLLSKNDQDKILAGAEIRLKLLADRLDRGKIGLGKDFEITPKSPYNHKAIPSIERPIPAREYIITRDTQRER